LKIKETFPNLQANKIESIQKIINNNGKPKPHINMTTKGSSRKQVIISINDENKIKFMEVLSIYITNLNHALKCIKLDIMAYFVCSKPNSIITVTNKVASSLDLQIIEKYIKNTNYIDVDKVKVPRLPQLKFYLKIIGILYINEKTNASITVDAIEDIIKCNHIFNNITVTSKPCVIKFYPKSDIAIIWLDI